VEGNELMEADNNQVHPSFGMVNEFTWSRGSKVIIHVQKVHKNRNSICYGESRQEETGGGAHASSGPDDDIADIEDNSNEAERATDVTVNQSVSSDL
jgi:hypothetical protein